MSGQHWRDEEGLSLVEMLIAIFVISIGLFALLASFLTSARSLQAQKSVAGATRAASSVFEDLRADGYDAITTAAIPTTYTANGITYTITGSVTESDLDPSNTLATDLIKTVDLTVGWTDPSGTRTRTYSTAVARPSTTASGPSSPGATIGDITISPTVIDVDADGDSLASVTITVPVSNLAANTVLTLEWTDDDGSHSRTAVWTSGSQVTFTLAAGEIDKYVPTTSTDTVTFSVSTGALVKNANLSVQQQPAVPLAITSAEASPNPIRVEAIPSNGSCAGKKCTNVTAVTFTAYVSGLDTSTNIDSVRVRFALQDGTNEEVVLVRDATDLTKWQVTLAAGTTKFKTRTTTGTEHQTFTFIAIRQSDGVQRSYDLIHPVHRDAA